jgi:hypothetical protein
MHRFLPLLLPGCENRGIPYEAVVMLIRHNPHAGWTGPWLSLANILSSAVGSASGHLMQDLTVLEGHPMFARLCQRDETLVHDPLLPDGVSEVVLKLHGEARRKPTKWWQMAVVRSLKLASYGVEEHLQDALHYLEDAVVHPIVSQELLSLQAHPSKLCSMLVEVVRQREKDDKNAQEASRRAWNAASAKGNAMKERMRFLDRLFQPPGQELSREILRFYNEVTCSSFEERLNTGRLQVKGLDPNSPDFDLGKQGCFKGFHVLIANFYRAAGFDRAQFQECLTSLRLLGFTVDEVQSDGSTVLEEKFIKMLDPVKYHVAWIISGQAVDWAKSLGTNWRSEWPAKETSAWSRFVNAVTRFHRSGRGLFIFGENDPFFGHANAVLKPLADVILKGDLKGEQKLGPIEDGDHKNGGFRNHLITGRVRCSKCSFSAKLRCRLHEESIRGIHGVLP